LRLNSVIPLYKKIQLLVIGSVHLALLHYLIKLVAFFWTLVLVSWQASCSSLYEAGFYKPTILKVHPPVNGITAHATMPGRLEHSMISFCFMLWSKWMVNERWSPRWGQDLNPPPSSHEFSALTTRPQQLTLKLVV
jgi:hypothetical protein